MKNLLVGVGILSILLTAAGCKKKAAPQQAALPVNVVTVIEKEVNKWDEFTGRLDPVESVEIRPRAREFSPPGSARQRKIVLNKIVD